MGREPCRVSSPIHAKVASRRDLRKAKGARRKGPDLPVMSLLHAMYTSIHLSTSGLSWLAGSLERRRKRRYLWVDCSHAQAPLFPSPSQAVHAFCGSHFFSLVRIVLSQQTFPYFASMQSSHRLSPRLNPSSHVELSSVIL